MREASRKGHDLLAQRSSRGPQLVRVGVPRSTNEPKIGLTPNPYCVHRRFRPQIARQCIALFGHLSQSLSLAAGVLARDHADVLATLLPLANQLGSPRNTSVAKAVTGPTPGCVRSRHAWARS
jgi:hypothetical protein